jgi:hypothetical protein
VSKSGEEGVERAKIACRSSMGRFRSVTPIWGRSVDVDDG